MHIPVLLNEVLKYLNPRAGENFIDATVGDGGHSAAILKKTAPDGKLLAIDRDEESLMRARVNLEKFSGRAVFANDSFGNILAIARGSGIEPVNGILFDFGMSTSQLEDSGRGFSFRKDEILDMRYDEKNSLTAEDIVNEYGEADLEKIFKEFGEERKSRAVAGAIVEARKRSRIKTTGELAAIIGKIIRRRGRIDPATKIFQALRIETNGELAEIEKALADVPEVLAAGGRAAFISFHSLEDRLIKNWSKKSAEEKNIKILNKKPITASAEEIKDNPKSRSAKLRVIEKI